MFTYSGYQRNGDGAPAVMSEETDIPDPLRNLYYGFVSPLFMSCVQPQLGSCCVCDPVPPVGSPESPYSHYSQQDPSLSPIYDGSVAAAEGSSELISKPHENDILCGKGWSKNPGNRKFRDIIVANKAAYDDCQRLTKKQKVTVARQIVKLIRNQQNPPGRFLSRNVKTGLWSDIGMSRSIEKTKMALQDKGPDSNSSCCSNSEATASCISKESSGGQLSHSSSQQSHNSSKSSGRDANKVPPIIIPPHLQSSFQNKNTATTHSPRSPASKTKFDWMYDIPSSSSPPHTATCSSPNSPPPAGEGRSPQYRYPRHYCHKEVGTIRHDRMAVDAYTATPSRISPASGHGAPQPNNWREHPLWAITGQQQQQQGQQQSISRGHHARTMPASFYMPTLAPQTKPPAPPSACNTGRRIYYTYDNDGGTARARASHRKRSDSDATPPRSNRADGSYYYHEHEPVSQPTPTTHRTAAHIISPEHRSSADWKSARKALGGWEEEEWEKDSMYLSSTEGDEEEVHLRGSSLSSLAEAMQSNLVLEDQITEGEEGLHAPKSTPRRHQHFRWHGSGEEVDGQTALSVAAFLKMDESD